MRVNITAGRPAGTVSAPPSKSFAHRMLICAALAQGVSHISGVAYSEDILATLDCLGALGAKYERDGDTVTVTGSGGAFLPGEGVFPCRESGSTLRFLIPLALALRHSAVFTGTARLMERGVGIYEELFSKAGVEFAKSGESIGMSGRFTPGEYALRGDVSSQFVSGLLFALPLLDGDSTLRVLPPVESRAYIDITVAALHAFGVGIAEREENVFFIRGGQRCHAADAAVEGDWSNAAFLYALNELGGNVAVKGLDGNSIQGDRACLAMFAALRKGGAEMDISGCPDLGPVLFAVAAAKNGGEFTGTRRLRIKESDRAQAMAQELEKLGAAVSVGEDSVSIAPGGIRTPGETLCGHNDHRIVMALSVLLTVAGGELDGAEAVKKSCPEFFSLLKSLGVEVNSDI